MGIFPSIDNLPEEPNTAPQDFNKEPLNITFSTTEYLFDTFLKGLDGILTNEQIKYEIVNYYDKYLDYDYFQSESTRKLFQQIWMNERFLIMFKDSLPIIKKKINKYHNKVICKIAYDYYTTFTNDTRNEAVTLLLFSIVEDININSILPLTTIMDKQSALFIVMSAHSEFDQEECVKRVNEFIVRLGYDFTVDNIIYIYSKLYSENFGDLFVYTMTNVYDYNSGDLSNFEYSIYNRISTALMVILDTMMTSVEIEKVLIKYVNYLDLYPDKKRRFEIKKNITDYNRVAKILATIPEEI